MTFDKLDFGDTFNFISPNTSENTFFKRCEKIGEYMYKDEDGNEHYSASKHFTVYHVCSYVIKYKYLKK